LSNLQTLCQNKDKGGLGVPDLRNLNLCLLASCVQCYNDDDSKLWRKIVDSKYQSRAPNLFCSESREASSFWKGILWAAQAAKMGYRWHVDDGTKIRFWEDHWFGSCSLAIQYWDIFSIVNEQGCTIKDAWDGANLRFTFRRTVDRRVLNLWYKLQEIASSIKFSEEPDSIVWKFNSNGRYSVKSLYAVVNDRGVRHIFSPVMWKIIVPS
jgi:hypothetical protein